MSIFPCVSSYCRTVRCQWLPPWGYYLRIIHEAEIHIHVIPYRNSWDQFSGRIQAAVSFSWSGLPDCIGIFRRIRCLDRISISGDPHIQTGKNAPVYMIIIPVCITVNDRIISRLTYLITERQCHSWYRPWGEFLQFRIFQIIGYRIGYFITLHLLYGKLCFF